MTSDLYSSSGTTKKASQNEWQKGDLLRLITLSQTVHLCSDAPTQSWYENTSTTIFIYHYIYFRIGVSLIWMLPLGLGLCTKGVVLHGKHEQQSWSHLDSSGSRRNPKCCHQPRLHAPVMRREINMLWGRSLQIRSWTHLTFVTWLFPVICVQMGRQGVTLWWHKFENNWVKNAAIILYFWAPPSS